MFKSQNLWDQVKKEYDEPDATPVVSDQQLRDNRKKDAKAFFFIESTLDYNIFPRISSVSNDFFLVCLYIDNIIYMGSKSLVTNFKSGILKTFEMSDLGLL